MGKYHTFSRIRLRKHHASTNWPSLYFLHYNLYAAQEYTEDGSNV